MVKQIKDCLLYTSCPKKLLTAMFGGVPTIVIIPPAPHITAIG